MPLARLSRSLTKRSRWLPFVAALFPSSLPFAGEINDAFHQPWTPPQPVYSAKAVPARASLVPQGKGPDFRALNAVETLDERGIRDGGVLSVPVGRDPARPFAGENRKRVGRFLRQYAESGGVMDAKNLKSLETFTTQNPGHALSDALLHEGATLAGVHGHFVKQGGLLKKSWEIARQRTTPEGRLLGDQVLCDYLLYLRRVGKGAELKQLLSEIQDRPLSGRAEEARWKAREILWFIEHQAEQNIFCGFTAANAVCVPLGAKPIFPDVHDEAERKAFIRDGLSLFELRAHSRESGGDLKIVRRVSGTAIPVPSVAHLNFSHYSALTEADGTTVRLADEHLQFNGWVESSVLNDQLSGYFLLPGKSEVPRGFVEVSDQEAKGVFGRHCNHGRDNEGPDCNTGCKSKGAPMADYGFSLLNPGLTISDTPVSYNTPYGPQVAFTLTYNQRAAAIDDLAQHANLGPRWSYQYLSYVRLDASLVPVPPGGTSSTPRPCSSVAFVDSVGAYYRYTYNTATRTYSSKYADRPRLEWYLNGAQSAYVLLNQDGSSMHFQQPNAANPTRYYLTKLVDNRGNALQLGYDSQLRLSSLVDALGNVTSLSYTPEAGDGVPSDTKKIRKITDPFGRHARLYYNANGRLSKIIDPVGITSEFSYGAADFIEKLTTPYGATTFAWGDLPGINSEPGRFIQATDPLGGTERAEANDLTSFAETDPNPAPNSVSVGGNAVSFLPKTYLLNYRNTFYWDKKMWRTGPGDYSFARVYNWLAVNNFITGVLGSTKEPLEARVWLNYPGQLSEHAPGSLNAPSKVVRLVEQPGGAPVWTMQLNDYGDRRAGEPVVNPNYAEVPGTGMANNPFAQLLGSVDAEGRTVIYNYAPNGIDLLSIQAKDGAAWRTLRSFSNYANHLPQTIREASGLQTAVTYNAQGQPTLVTRSKAGKSESTRFTYDRNLDGTPDDDGYLIRVEKTSESGAFVLAAAYGYDAAGRVRTQTDADGYTVTLDYDNIDRVTLVTHPDGTTEQTDYRWLDPVAVKDRGGLWSRTQYNALRKPVLVQDPAGLVTQLEWCKCGDIQKITDPSGNLTQWRRDAQGRVFEKVYPDQSRDLMTYQPLSGRLAATTRPGDAVPTITYGYALSGRLTREDYLAEDTPDVSYEYNDFMGRLTRRVDGAGATVFGYHPLDGSTPGAGQPATVDGPLADDTFAYSYDWGDRQVSSRLLADSGAVLRSEALSIDSLGRVATVTNGLGTFANLFNPGNNGPRIDRRTGPGGFSLSAGYFPQTTQAGRALKLQSLEYAINGAAPFAAHRYDYDASGRITAWEQDRGGDRDAYMLGYDRSSRLIESVKTGASGGEARSWRYDGAGNRILSNQGTATTPSFFNGLNQVLRVGGSGRTLIEGTVDETATVKVNGQPAQTASAPGSGQMVFRKMVEVAEGSNVVEIEARDASNNVRSERWRFEVGGVRRQFEYDAAGNTTADGTRLYGWDAANRLRRVTVGGSVYEWEYDGLSRRVLEKRDGTVRKRFVWDAGRLVQERDGENRVLRTYYGDGFEEGGKIYVYAKDHLGSVREVVDAAGGVVAARYDYDLWGGRSKLAGNAETPWGYTGHYTHEETGLVLALYRAYDPDTGRWLSRDPLGNLTLPQIESPSTHQVRRIGAFAQDITQGRDPGMSYAELLPEGPNIYSYVGDNPINLIDPLGLWYFDINISGGAWFGLTCGVFIGPNGVHPYFGGGAMTPGVSSSISWSPQDSSPGCWSGQAGAELGPFFGAAGYGGGSGFWEAGVGWGWPAPFGANLVGYYTW